MVLAVVAGSACIRSGVRLGALGVGRRPEVDHVKRSFLKELDSAERLFTAVTTAGVGLHQKHVRNVVSLAFMGMVAAWEEFVERTLVRYVAGAQTKAGYAPALKVGRANDLDHAYCVLSGDMKYVRQSNYLRVSDGVDVAKRADFFFKAPHGYAALRSSALLLRHAGAIRNRVAHSSEKCRTDFKQTVVFFLAPSSGKLTQGYGPGDLLLAPAVRHFGPNVKAGSLPHFRAYVRLYRDLAGGIVP